MDYISVSQARGLPGLRVAFTRGVPGPWGVSAMGILDLKGITYAAVAQEAGRANAELQEWTGQSSAPVAMYEDERPRSGWAEILMLAERLAPEPRLVPADEALRAEMFGLCHEICAEDGLGWNLRLLMLAGKDSVKALPRLGHKYGSAAPLEHAARRVNAVVALLARRLAAQRALRRPGFVGETLTAADIYWTAFSNLLDAMAPELCPMPDFYREMGAITSAVLEEPLPQLLLDHRDAVARSCFRLPIVQ